MKYNDNGLVIYEGESMLNKSTEIIAILTGVISPSKSYSSLTHSEMLYYLADKPLISLGNQGLVGCVFA